MSRPDAGGFEHVIMPHLGAAYNLARWLVRNPALAEDVAQDAMVRALSYFASFRGGDGRAWLLRIVRHAAYDALAAIRGVEGDADAALAVPDPADSPEASLSRQQDQGRLRQALAALPDELRECIVLRELEGLTYKEIAHVTGVPIGTVMSRLWRGRQALLGSQAEGGPP